MTTAAPAAEFRSRQACAEDGWGEALPRRSTLLDLVQLLQNRFDLSEEQVVATAAALVNSGRVALCGNFAGQTLS